MYEHVDQRTNVSVCWRMARHVRMNTRLCILLSVVTGLVLVALLVAVIVLGTKHCDQRTEEFPCSDVPSNPQAMLDLMAFFNVTDGFDVKWSETVASRTDAAKAASENSMVNLEVTVSRSSPRTLMVGNDSTLQQVLDIVTSSSHSTGVKLNLLQTDSTMSDAIAATKHVGFAGPVIISIPVVFGANMTKHTERFLQSLKNTSLYGRNLTGVNIDLTSCCGGDRIGIGTMEYVYNMVKNVGVSVSVEIDIDSLRQSAGDVKWFMDRSERFRLILSSASPTSRSRYDLLLIRNDMDKNKVFYNIQGTLYDEFAQLMLTAGSPMLYFNIHPRDAGKVVWSHNTDTWELLKAATSGDVMMIEGDIMLKGQGTPQQQNIPIMAHDVGDDNNLTFAQWFDEILKVKKGMKFDFKALDAVQPSLEIVLSKRDQVNVPIWLNADILQGPNGKPSSIPPEDFLKAIQPFPEAILSLGWTTFHTGPDTNYTVSMMEEMNRICQDLPQPVTFPVRAELVKESWKELDWLLKQSRGYTLTIWTAPNDDVTKEDMEFVKRQSELSRVYFDLPKELRPDFS